MSLRLNVDGMSCDHCVASITKAVTAIPGVTDVRVDLADKSVTVGGDADETRVVDAIEDCGYDVHRAA
ncbi:heavy-metal-associated domain-containing protein [Mycolicibacterium sp. S2-37]|uniref:heavy-metal-associated domain-containing protein n=1 Tax=Mycolicibacterium sp. S2-37 TaxID=2810297 RepID=UPI001A94CDAE|nr:copper ion binding protein [Mycolicibacterium sp. S2-37]MBO0679681.1 heavy-metal-associated domain-containing protein [Mycolicibacterium sp. S2-37]